MNNTLTLELDHSPGAGQEYQTEQNQHYATTENYQAESDATYEYEAAKIAQIIRATPAPVIAPSKPRVTGFWGTALHVTLDAAGFVAYGEYYGSYQLASTVNHFGDEFGTPGRVVSRVVSSVTVPFQAAGLAGDAGIDWLKGHTVNHETIWDEGRPIPVNTFHEWTPSWVPDPYVWGPGLHRNGRIDIQW
jgi:hypothetical protein